MADFKECITLSAAGPEFVQRFNGLSCHNISVAPGTRDDCDEIQSREAAEVNVQEGPSRRDLHSGWIEENG